MKNIVKIMSILMLNLSLVSSVSYSADQNNNNYMDNKNFLRNYEQDLIGKGREILGSIKNNNFDAITPALPIISEIPQDIKNNLAFNKMGEYAPSAWLKYYLPNSSVMVERQEYLAKLIGLGWALDSLANEQGDSFGRGSFSIVDPGNKVFNFLLGYVSLVTGQNNPKNLLWALTPNNFAYRRDPSYHGSSHHHGQTPESQFGIDIRFTADQTVYGLLPSGHRHILFGKLNIPGSDLPLTFVKFEPVGLGSAAELAAHSLNFAKSGQLSGVERREKDIPIQIQEFFEKILPNSGIKKIHQMINHPYFKDNQDQYNIFIDFLKTIYHTDDIELLKARTGNEVILDLR